MQMNLENKDNKATDERNSILKQNALGSSTVTDEAADIVLLCALS